MEKKGRKQPAKDVPPITPNIKIADLVRAYPDVLDVLIKMGFEPLRNAVTRKIVAKLFTLEQAASFRGVNLEEMLATIRRAAGIEVCEEGSALRPESSVTEEGPVPDLKGDAAFLGLVPCPIRSVLLDKFQAFVQKLTASTGNTVAWWMAGEGPGIGDVRAWLSRLIEERSFGRIPDLLMGVGTEIFLHKKYGRSLYDEGIWGTIQTDEVSRLDLRNLEDPGGKLTLQFAVLFVFSCRPDRLPSGVPPRRWTDLAKPEFRGQVALPSLDLPIMPDLLGALYHYLGEEQFSRLASNIATTLHPARASPRAGVKDVPGVVILPLHFSKLAIATGGVQIVPEDGPVAVPAYLAMKSDASQVAASVARYLTSKDFLEPFWRLGRLVPNLADIPTDMQFEKLISRPWEAIFMEDLDAIPDRLISMIKTGGAS